MKQQQCPPPHPSPRELLLPQDIPEMHSRGVGQLGGVVEDKRSNPSKEWNVSILGGGKEFGAHGNTVRTDTHKGELQKDRELQKGTREKET